ncbi:MAG: DUF480 domain-containing protein [Elusimicrobia bacterium]|nr:DUF480 domain-containing protein [Elusimicrobiota bacterium]
MKPELDAVEARILGCLIEKSYLTPDLYPLTFNALRAACNQKTSREPVMELDDDTLHRGLERLARKGLAAQRHGSRAPKFAHHAEHLDAGDSTETFSLLAVLLLRGPQTAAELRVRTDRMAHFATNENVENLLQKLAEHPQGPFVARLSRGRWQHLLSGDAPVEPVAAAAPARAAAPPDDDRLAKLEARVASLETQLRELQDRLARPTAS